MSDTRKTAPEDDRAACGPIDAPSENLPAQPALMVPSQTPQWSAEALIGRWKRLLRLKKQLWNPFAVVIASVSGACWLYQFVIGMGSLSYPLLGFGVLTLFALLVPEGAPRLFALRTFAFAIDVLFLGILTVAILPMTFGTYGRPSESAVTCAVWLWFTYFAFFDWRFKGTPGKRMLGLKIVFQKASFGLYRSLLRTSLTLLLPLLAGLWVEKLLAAGDSRTGFAFALMVQTTLQLANPVSIVVLGGNRGFADRVAGTEIRIGASRPRRRDLKLASWAYACALPFMGGLAIACYGYIWLGLTGAPTNSSFGIPAKPAGKDLVAVRYWEDPGGKFKTTCVAPGFRDISKEVQSVGVETLSSNPFTVEDTGLPVNSIDATNLRQAQGLPIVRITTTSWISPAGYWLIVRNLAACYAANSEDGGHSTVVIQFEQLDDYGFFVFVRHQDTVLSVDRRASTASWSMADLRPRAGAEIFVSSDLGGFALLGRGNIREYFLDRY